MNVNSDVNEDFVDILSALLAEEAEFLVVGAYALAAHGYPRATGDIDILVKRSSQNAERVFRSLLSFGAPVQAHGVEVADFEKSGTVYQVGVPPRRIDLITSLSGVDYAEAEEEALSGFVGHCRVRFIGRRALIRNKRAAGRTKDIADAEQLEQAPGSEP